MAYPIAAGKKLTRPHSPLLPWLLQRTLQGIEGPESLVVRSRWNSGKIVGLAELRVTAMLASRDAMLGHCFTDDYGVHSLLDLAVRFGLSEIAAALAECGIGFCGQASFCTDKYFEDHASRSLRAVVEVAKISAELIRKVTVSLTSELPYLFACEEDEEEHPAKSKQQYYSYFDIALKLGAFEDALFLVKCGVPSIGYRASDLAYWAFRHYDECDWAPQRIPIRCRHETLPLPAAKMSRERAPCTHGVNDCRFCSYYISLDLSYALHPMWDVEECKSLVGNPWRVFFDMLERHIVVARFSSDLAEFLRQCRFQFGSYEGDTLSLLDLAIRFGVHEVVQKLILLQVPVTTDVITSQRTTNGHEIFEKERLGRKQFFKVLVAAELAGFIVEDLLSLAIRYGNREALNHFMAEAPDGLPGLMVEDLVELAIRCGNVEAVDRLLAKAPNNIAKRTPKALLQSPGRLEKTVINAAVAAGADMRRLYSQKPQLACCFKAPPGMPPNFGGYSMKPAPETECEVEPLLAKAIRYGQKDLAQELSLKGCDSGLTAEALMRMVVFGQLHDFDVHGAAFAAFKRCQHRHHLVLVQMSRWWKRSSLGLVSALNVPLLEKIASLASAVPAMPIPQALLSPLIALCRCLPHNSIRQSERLCRGGLFCIVSSHLDFRTVSAEQSSNYPGPRQVGDATSLKSAAMTEPMASATPYRLDVLPVGSAQMPVVSIAEGAAKELSALETQELSDALRASADEVVSSYNADLAKALSLSKIDRGGLSDDKIVVLRLSCRTAEVEQKLFHSVDLLDIRERVVEAGCELMPEWAFGAIFLVPLTRDMIIEANVDELRAHHVLALEDDVDRIKGALAEIPKRRRPKVKGRGVGTPQGPPEADSAQGNQSGAGHDVSLQSCTESLASEQIGLIVERTFLSYLEPKEISECSRVAQSAPSCIPMVEGMADSRNPRRWGKLV